MSETPVFSRRSLFKHASTSLIAGSVILMEGRKWYRGNLGGVWEAFRGKAASDNVAWAKIESMPHCFNARDAIDPDQGYYQGPGWYRVTIKPNNPYPNGRTLLHFEGAGQKSKVNPPFERDVAGLSPAGWLLLGCIAKGVRVGVTGSRNRGYDCAVVDLSLANLERTEDPTADQWISTGDSNFVPLG